MKNKIIVGCDLHNTLLLSNDAWINAFLKFEPSIDKDSLTKDIYNKKSRKELANLYRIDYEELLSEYHNLCSINKKLVLFIKQLQEKKFKVLLISLLIIGTYFDIFSLSFKSIISKYPLQTAIGFFIS